MGNFFGGGGGGSKLPALSDNGTNVISTEPITVPDTAGSGVPSVKGATAATGLYLNGTVDGLVSGTGSWISVGQSVGQQPQLPNTGILGWSTSNTIAANGSDTFIRKRSTANIALGAADVNGVPVAQTISFQNAITGTNLAPVTATIAAPLGTGNGAGSAVKIQRALMQASGATAHTLADSFATCESKTLSNTSATLTTLATIGLASNSAGGASGTVTVVATDGTNFDVDTQSFTCSFVNKAGVITLSTPTLTTATPASNSGSTTTGFTITAGASLINLNVTPVFTTIVPTTVTAYLTLTSNGTGAITAL